jgi:cytochrome c oxidase assembly protein subunit 15
MPRRFTQLAWAAATATYLLIILGAIVRITGSGMGCGDHWPLCNSRLLPPLDVPTMIEYGHRLAAAAVSVLVVGLAGYAWWLTRGGGRGKGEGSPPPPRGATTAAYVALTLIAFEVTLGRFVVKLGLPAITVIVHLANAMLILAALLVAARPGLAGSRGALGAAALGFVTVLLGALVANTGAATACLGFPLCNGEWLPAGSALQHIHWTHRLFGYALAAYVLVWAWNAPVRAPRYVLALVAMQVAVAAAMVLLALPPALQAAHVAVGAAVWAGLVLAAL